MTKLLVPVCLLAVGCATGSWQTDLDRLERDIAVTEQQTVDPEVERALSDQVDPETLVKLALVRNPEARETLARAQAAVEEVRRAGAWDDPMLKLEARAVPLDQPLAFNRDDTNMFGISQNIPFPGKLSLRAESVLREAESMFQKYREREREIVARVKKTYYDYFQLHKELEIHLDHVKILEEFEQISNVKFRTGTVTQQDVLKPQVELVMLHNDVLFIQQKLESAKAAINVLLNRPVNAPLGKPKEISPADERFNLDELQAKAVEVRPELLAAKFRLRSSETAREFAHRDATLPDFSIGIDYSQMPEMEDAWGGMIGVNLPWFTGKKSAEARRMDRIVRADELALQRIRNQIAWEVRDAYLRVEAARKSVVLFRGELLPKSEQSVEVSRASYEKERATFLDLLDAERSQRDVKLGYYRSLATYESAIADLEKAVGVDLRRKP